LMMAMTIFMDSSPREAPAHNIGVMAKD
jgi:hypothetical protein